MADIKIAGRIKAGAADGISGYASEILFDDAASNKTVKEKIEEVASSPQTMIVTITPDGNDGYEADKTFAEIAAFIDNGGTVIAKDEEDGDSYYYLDNYIASEVVFTRNIWGSGGFSTRYYTIDNTNTVSFIDSVHHISSAVNSSSTANLANSAAVKALRDSMSEIKSISVNNTEQQVDQEGNVDIAVPTSLADLAGDSTHRTVTDAEKSTWNGKQNALTFDNVPTANSNNPVKSGGIKTALDAKQDTISDIATIRSNAAAGATAYQKPGTGIPKTDFASAVQTSLGKADTAIQSVAVGTTTTGAAGSSASVTNTGTATAPVLNFTIPQGAQGEKGDTVIMGSEATYTLYNTTGDAVDGAMTQQAVTSELTELEGEVNGLEEVVIDPTSIDSIVCYINSRNFWQVNNTNSKGRIVEVIPERTIKIKANSGDSAYIAFVKGTTPVNGAAVEYATGETGRRVLSAGDELTLTVPSDAVYLWFARTNYAHDYTPQSIVMPGKNGLEQRVQSAEQDIDEIKSELLVEDTTASQIPVYATTDNAGLFANTGRAFTDVNYELKKYEVQEGQKIRLHLSGTSTYGTYQFQTVANLPSGFGDDNPNRVGGTITGNVDGDVTVPATAKFLIVSQLKTTTTNTVKAVSLARLITALNFENGSIGDDGRNNPSRKENNFFRCFRTGNYVKADKLYYNPVGNEVVTVFTYTGEMKLIEKQAITGDFTPDKGVAYMKVQVFFNATDNVVPVTIEQGGLDNTGAEETSSTWVRTGYIDIDNPGFDTFWFLGKMKGRIYDSAHNLLSDGTSFARFQNLFGGIVKFRDCLTLLYGSTFFGMEAKYIRLAFATANDAAITPSTYDVRFTLGDLPRLPVPKILAANYEEIKNEYVSTDTISFAFRFHATGNGQQVSLGEISSNPTLYDNHDYMTSGVLLLPPNYTHKGKPVPLIIYVHGSGDYGYLGTNVLSQFYMDYLGYWQKEGFAVADFFARTSKYGAQGGDVNGMPTNLAAYEQGYKWLVEHYNIDASGCFVTGKSMGGVGALMLCYSKSVPVKAADILAPALNPFYQQCGYGILSRADYINDLRLVGAEGLLNNPSPASPMSQTDFNALMIANRDKLVGYNAYLSKVSNKTWAELIALKFKNPGTFDDVIKFCEVPLRIHIAEDDTTVAYNQSLNLITALKNSGSIAEIRTMPANTGQHHAVDNSPDALKVASITTELGYTCTDVPLAYVEAASWFKFYR